MGLASREYCAAIAGISNLKGIFRESLVTYGVPMVNITVEELAEDVG
jgi:hypothetical protein